MAIQPLDYRIFSTRNLVTELRDTAVWLQPVARSLDPSDGMLGSIIAALPEFAKHVADWDTAAAKPIAEHMIRCVKHAWDLSPHLDSVDQAERANARIAHGHMPGSDRFVGLFSPRGQVHVAVERMDSFHVHADIGRCLAPLTHRDDLAHLVRYAYDPRRVFDVGHRAADDVESHPNWLANRLPFLAVAQGASKERLTERFMTPATDKPGVFRALQNRTTVMLAVLTNLDRAGFEGPGLVDAIHRIGTGSVLLADVEARSGLADRPAVKQVAGTLEGPVKTIGSSCGAPKAKGSLRILDKVREFAAYGSTAKALRGFAAGDNVVFLVNADSYWREGPLRVIGAKHDRQLANNRDRSAA